MTHDGGELAGENIPALIAAFFPRSPVQKIDHQPLIHQPAIPRDRVLGFAPKFDIASVHTVTQRGSI